MIRDLLRWTVSVLAVLLIIVAVIVIGLAALAALVGAAVGAGTWALLRVIAGPLLLETFHNEAVVMAVAIGIAVAGAALGFLVRISKS
ncbi:MAG: hypothetical protein AB1806_15245 [Acidobacteriota bacterium]